ncbi:MAG: DNA primase [Opitutales bacterium]|nr:DNA primase [Opitutales bacterium]MCH8540973.1 DNA primase [Opitutales bacterium]
MAYIKRECIDQILHRVSLLDVASAHTQLKRVGSQYSGLSPFQTEKTPSFFVNPEKNLFKCFSSGKAGNLFHFVMETENLTFPEAVETLAHRFGIELEYESGGPSREERSLRQELLEIHDLATAFFHEHLMASGEASETTRTYWTEERQFPLSLALEEKIGLSPPNGDRLWETLRRKGISREALNRCGLFYTRENVPADRPLPARFRHRLMIPIRDLQGRVIAFTARQLPITPEDDPTHQAKYINSPETPLFQKNQILFGLDKARPKVGEEKPFLLVEGQLDVLRCRDKGLTTAVAPQGTAITENQLALLRRSGAGVEVMLDSDQAGLKAALRIIPMALKIELPLTFLPLPEGADPDSWLLQEGTEAFQELRQKQARHPVDFACEAIFPSAQRENASPEDKLQAAKKFFGLLESCESNILRSEYLQRAAPRLNLDESTLSSEFDRHLRKQNQYRPATLRGQEQDSSAPTVKPLTRSERVLLQICLQHEEIGEATAQIMDPVWLATDFLEGRLLARVLADFQHDMWQGTQHIDHLAETEEERIFLASLLFEDFSFPEPWKQADVEIRKIFTRYYRSKMKEIEIAIANTGTLYNDDTLFLQRKRLELRKLKTQPPSLQPSAVSHSHHASKED